MNRSLGALALGRRLAVGSTGHGRLRSLAVVAASVAGTALVLATLTLATGLVLVGVARTSPRPTDSAPGHRDTTYGIRLVGAVVLLLGTTLALGLGWVAAETYRHLIGSTLRIPTGFTWPMSSSVIIGACLVAWVTSLAANTRIRPRTHPRRLTARPQAGRVAPSPRSFTGGRRRQRRTRWVLPRPVRVADRYPATFEEPPGRTSVDA